MVLVLALQLLRCKKDLCFREDKLVFIRQEAIRTSDCNITAGPVVGWI